jgi:ABC-type methionine transport system permease subunit
VREIRIARAFVVLICIALLLLCTAIGPSAAHLDLAIPALVFCFFAVLRLSLLRVSDGDSDVQPISFLTLHISRAPPLA